jgi:3-oxoacyl-[acyl-carrier protein] reductase
MRASFDATGDVVVVTGGASGIGAAVAAAVAAHGGQAVVFDVVAAPSSERIEPMQVDVSDREAVRSAIADVVERHGRITGLIAGAAIQPRVTIEDTDPETWGHVIDVNLNGVVWACQAVVPVMRSQGRGSIVVFTSGLAQQGRAEASAYAATKGAMLPFAKSLAGEVAADGIRVNVIAPGVIDTPQFREANPAGPERDHWQRTTGIGMPEDVVGPLLFLLSDAASMTGSTLSRDRAFHARPEASS